MKLNEMLAIPTAELSKHTTIQVTVLPDMPSYYLALARHMADIVKKNNAADKATSLILPVGPTLQYPEFAKIVNRERIDCRNVVTLHMDEYLDWQGRMIPENHQMSFRKVIREMLWSKIEQDIRIPWEKMFFPDVCCPEKMDEAFDTYGPADACYAGVGYHGHVAFNEAIISRWYKVPEDEFMNARTHIIALADDTFVINSVREAGGNCEMFPPFAITIGMKDIMASKEMVGVFYCGHWQQTMFRRTLFQEPTLDYPGTYLKNHPNFRVFADAITAAPPQINPF